MLTSTKNPQIKEIQKLRRKRHRYQTKRLVLEGVRLIQDALASNILIQTLYFAPELITKNRAAIELVEHCQSASIQIVECSETVFQTLTETTTPQGILALIAMPDIEPPINSSLALILDQVREPGNAGTLLRSAEAAGVDQVLFAPNTVDSFNDKVIRAGMGAHFRLPIQLCNRWDDVRSRLSAEQILVLATPLGKIPYDQLDWCQPVALIISGETTGASPDAIGDALSLSVPMLGQTESLNAAMAGTIILFEGARQRRLGKS